MAVNEVDHAIPKAGEQEALAGVAPWELFECGPSEPPEALAKCPCVQS